MWPPVCPSPAPHGQGTWKHSETCPWSSWPGRSWNSRGSGVSVRARPCPPAASAQKEPCRPQRRQQVPGASLGPFLGPGPECPPLPHEQRGTQLDPRAQIVWLHWSLSLNLGHPLRPMEDGSSVPCCNDTDIK